MEEKVKENDTKNERIYFDNAICFKGTSLIGITKKLGID